MDQYQQGQRAQQPRAVVSQRRPGLRYLINAPGFEGRQIVVQGSGWFSGAKIFLDNRPAAKGPKRGTFLLSRNDGQQVEAQLRGTLLDPVPKLVLNGEQIELERPFQWYEWLWICLPIVLLFLGGGLGGLLGGLSLAINARILRAQFGDVGRFLLSGAVSAAAVLFYFVLVVAFLGATGKLPLAGLTSPTVSTSPLEWQTFTAPDGRAAVAMPIPPKAETRQLQVGNTALTQNLYIAEINGGKQTLTLSYIDHNFDQSEDFKSPDKFTKLDKICAVVTEKQNEKLRRQLMKSSKFDALEFSGSGRIPSRLSKHEIEVWGRIYLINNRAYCTMAVFDKGTMNSGEAIDFLNSFRLLDN